MIENLVKPAKHSAMEFAKYIIDFCTNAERAINEIRLQKVLYFIQLSFILNRKEYAFTDEFEAHQFGPIIKEIRETYANYGGTKICLMYPDSDIFNDDEKKIILSVLLKCFDFDTWELVEMSKGIDSPWDLTYKNREENGNIISKKLIKEYALKKIKLKGGFI